ncbi:MAG: NTP transferase domain-containing protein [Planctomycetota bacterium]
MTDAPTQPDDRRAHAVIMAAGKGKRMNSDLPKVVHQAAGKPMVRWVVEACLNAGVDRCVIVIGVGADRVKDALADLPQCRFVVQAEQLGTGHAARMAEPKLQDDPDADVLVLAGDGPLIRASTLRTLLDLHRSTGAAASLATAVLDDPAGYGRIVRNPQGGFARIVEQKDAGPDELQIREVNPSYYAFRCGPLFDALARVSNQNASGEYYVTDVPGLLLADGHAVSVMDAVPAEDVLSVNNPEQLAEVDAVLRRRLAASAAPAETASP